MFYLANGSNEHFNTLNHITYLLKPMITTKCAVFSVELFYSESKLKTNNL